jgi:hypothetical protein
MLKTSCSLILASAILAACAPTTVVKSNQLDIARMTPDCKNKHAQLRFLESQLSRPSGVLRDNATAEQERSYRATVMTLIWDIRQQCS